MPEEGWKILGSAGGWAPKAAVVEWGSGEGRAGCTGGFSGRGGLARVAKMARGEGGVGNGGRVWMSGLVNVPGRRKGAPWPNLSFTLAKMWRRREAGDRETQEQRKVCEREKEREKERVEGRKGMGKEKKRGEQQKN